MKRPKRDILVVVKNQQHPNEHAIEQEVEWLNEILYIAESEVHFCVAHELVDRNHITQKPARILKSIRYTHLPAFRFLLNKN